MTTIEDLIHIDAGTEADSETLNDNFTFLKSEITRQIDVLKGGVNKTIADVSSEVSAVQSYVVSGGVVPVGAVFYFAMGFPDGTVATSADVPTGYLLCDGQLHSKSDYENLYLFLKGNRDSSVFGESGDSFRTPNLIGLGIRGNTNCSAQSGLHGVGVSNYFNKSFAHYHQTTVPVGQYCVSGGTPIGNVISTNQVLGSGGAVGGDSATGVDMNASHNHTVEVDVYTLDLLPCIKY